LIGPAVVHQQLATAIEERLQVHHGERRLHHCIPPPPSILF
jgi:hypothetical protein